MVHNPRPFGTGSDLEAGADAGAEGGGVGVAKKFFGRELSLDEKVEMVEQNRDRYGLNRCLEALSIAKSSWHYRHNGYGRPRAKAEEIEGEMRQIVNDHPDYGRLHMTVELRERLGYRINGKRVERLLRDNGWGMIRHLPRRSERRSKDSSSEEGELE
ncbi:MAG: transposase [Acidobacteria bacterium]|nr:transposase [Acidobacteriota bacterium]